MFIDSDLCVVLLLVLEEQLVASHHEKETARVWGFIIAKDCEWMVVVGV